MFRVFIVRGIDFACFYVVSVFFYSNSVIFLLFQFIFHTYFLYLANNYIGGAMVSVFASRAVERGFGPRSDQIKDYTICICWFSAKHTTLRRKNKDWLTLNLDNVSDWSDMSIHGLLFQWSSTIKIRLSVLV